MYTVGVLLSNKSCKLRETGSKLRQNKVVILSTLGSLGIDASQLKHVSRIQR
jgi:hypothetical protein